MSIDTSQTTEIHGAPLKMLGLAILSLALVVTCVAMVAGYGPPLGYDDWQFWAVGVGVPFFGFTTVMIIWRMATQRGPVVTLSPEGILDTRVTAAPIPWRAIRGISTWTMQRQNVMVLDVDPEVEKTLPLTRIARWSRGANRKLGADGLCVTAQGLKTNYDQLLETATAYARAAHAKSA